MTDTTELLHKYMMQPAFSGAVGTAIFMGVYGNQGVLKMGSIAMSPAFVFGLSIAAGDAVGTAVTDAISESNKVAQLDVAQKQLIKPMVTGAITLATLSMFVAPPRDLASAGKIIALGGASNIGGGYLHDIVMSTVA